MHRHPGGSKPSPVRPHPPRARPATLDDDVWLELEGRGWTLTGSGSGVAYRRTDAAGGGTADEWPYAEIRSFQLLDGGHGASIVIEPRRGPPVAIPIDPERTEEAYQAATVLGLLLARSQRGVGVRRRG